MKQLLICLLAGLLASTHCYAYNVTEAKQWVDSVFDQMSPEERIGQLFYIHAKTNYSDRAILLGEIKQYKVGGIHFTSGTPSAQAEMTELCRQQSRTPLLATHSSEWGIAMQFPSLYAVEAITDSTLQQRYYNEEIRQQSITGIIAYPQFQESSRGEIASITNRSTTWSVPQLPISQLDALNRLLEEGKIARQAVESRCLEVLTYKYSQLPLLTSTHNTQNLLQRINDKENQTFLRQLNEAAITTINNTALTLPFKKLGQRTFAILSIGADSITPFQTTVQLYTPATLLTLSTESTPEQREKIAQAVAHSNTLVVALHSSEPHNITLAKKISQNHPVTLVSFISPEKVSEITPTQGALLAYQNTPLMQNLAAQALFGGIATTGRCPISINTTIAQGAGTNTHHSRLGYATPAEVGVSSQKLNQIDSIALRAIAKKAMPGCQILVARKGKIIYHKSFGYFDYAQTHRVTNNDIYDLASVSKAVGTLPAIMKLYDEKKLTLESKLSSYIPELKETNKEAITIKEALYHQSGLPAVVSIAQLAIDPESYKGHPLYQGTRTTTHRSQIGEKLYTYSNTYLHKTLFQDTLSKEFSLPVADGIYAHKSLPDSVLHLIANGKLYSKSYRYSCLNFFLLKKAAENITQEPLDNYLNRHIYQQLGADRLLYNPLARIPRTQIAPTENDQMLRKQIVIGHVHDEMAAFCGGVGGNAGLFANSNDLAKVLQMYLNQGTYGGERIISTKTTHLFTTAKSPKSRRGLGFDKPDTQNTRYSPTCQEAPASVYGHTGYTGTSFWVDPSQELIYIFLTNRIYPNRWNTELIKMNVRTDIQSAIYQSIYSK